MKMKKFQPCALNEALMQSASTAADNRDGEIMAATDPTYTDAMNQSRKTDKELSHRFEEMNKEAEKFVETNHEREVKVKTTPEMKKAHLSEALFEDFETPVVHDEEIVDEKTETSTQTLTEATDFGDPTELGRAACSPLVPDFTSSIRDYVQHMGEPGVTLNGLNGFVRSLFDSKETVERFNAYWTERYPLLIQNIDDQVAMIPQDMLRQVLALKEDLVEAPVDTEEEPAKKRTRAGNEKKWIGDYSSEDLWLAVYDELSAEVDNEGSGQQVDKQIKARRGERYEKVFPHGDSDIIIYATKPEEFEFARKVAEYYGVVAEEPKEDKNKNTNGLYKYSMVIRIPEDELYSEDE